MTLWLVLFVLVVIAFVVWAVEKAPFLSDTMKPFIRWAAMVLGGLYVLKLLFDLLGSFPHKI